MFDNEFDPYDILHQHEQVINCHTQNFANMALALNDFSSLIEFVNNQQQTIIELEKRIKQLEDKQ